MEKKIIKFCFLFYALVFTNTLIHLTPISTEPTYFFNLKMIAPMTSTGNPYAGIITKELSKIGIKAELDYINWGIYGSRTAETEVGTYNEGGYDICVWVMGLDNPDGHHGAFLQKYFGSENIPPL